MRRSGSFLTSEPDYFLALRQDSNWRERNRIHKGFEYREKTGDSQDGCIAAEYALKMERVFYHPIREKMVLFRELLRNAVRLPRS